MNTQNLTSRAAFYPRVSRTGKRSQADLERHTLREQRDLSLAFLPRSVELVEDERYVDVNVSGTHSERPGLSAVLEDVERGCVDAVVVGYLSRFGRNARELLENLERLHAAGATLYVARDGLTVAPGTRGVGKLLYTILGAVAEMEADRLADGLASANATAIGSGVSISVPYGYMRENGPGSPLAFDERDAHGTDVEDPETTPADVVRRIFAWASDGVGDTEIARRLNATGLPSPSRYAQLRGRRDKQVGGTWKNNTVRGILETYTYRGVIPRWQMEPHPTNPRRRVRVDGTLELLPAEHAPLIDDETWAAAQRDVTAATRTGKIGGALLTGLVRCASCSATMTPGAASEHKLTYNCISGKQRGCPAPTSIMRHKLDEYVERLVIDDLLGDEGDASPTVNVDELVELDRRIVRARAELDAFRQTASPVELGPDFVPTLRRLRETLDSVERERADLTREAARGRRLPQPDVYATLDVDERRAVLSDLLDAVVVASAGGRGKPRLPVEERVVDVVLRGRSPIVLSSTGRPQPLTAWPTEAD